MTANEYQREALRTDALCIKENWNCGSEETRLLNGLMGLSGEAGEAIDILKKHLFQGHALDRMHLAKELGDVAWYLAASADALGFGLEDIFGMNVEKLRRRYPEGFEPERSKNREKSDI